MRFARAFHLFDLYERLPYWIRMTPECWVIGQFATAAFESWTAVAICFAGGGAWGTIMAASDAARRRYGG